MKKRYLETGKIVGTHGIKGMVRVQPWADDSEFLKQFKTFYIDSQGNNCLKSEQIKISKNIVLIKFKGIDSVPEAEALRGTIIYIDRKDVKLPNGRYFVDDLIDCEVYDENNATFYGKISDVSKTGANDVWHIKNNDKEYLFPAVEEMLGKIDIESEKIYIKPIKGIFSDED